MDFAKSVALANRAARLQSTGLAIPGEFLAQRITAMTGRTIASRLRGECPQRAVCDYVTVAGN
jgi:hypothetical protein